MRNRFLMLGAMLALTACGSDDPSFTGEGGGGGGVNNTDADLVLGLPDPVRAPEVLSIAAAERGQDGAQNPSIWANVGGLQASFLLGTSIRDSQPGRTTQLPSTDVNGDGLNESDVRVFATESNTYLAWEGRTVVGEGDDAVTLPSACHLLWEENAGRFYVRSGCGESAGVACRIDSVPAVCSFCTDEACEECEVNEGIAACNEPDIPDEPDVGVDTGDVQDDPDTGGGEDTGPGDTGGGDDTGGGVTFGECDPACLIEFETEECCTGCGCTAFDCQPVCPDGTEWDCEQQCCFNFDVLECLD